MLGVAGFQSELRFRRQTDSRWRGSVYLPLTSHVDLGRVDMAHGDAKH
jgi:hypothetical protein